MAKWGQRMTADEDCEDVSNIMLPLRKANEDYLSESEKEALDASIQENASLSFEQLKNKSDDKIWQKNYREGKGKKVSSTMDLAKSTHASEAMKEYIKEGMEIERAFGMTRFSPQKQTTLIQAN